MTLIVSGGKDAFGKSFIFQNKPFILGKSQAESLEDAAALNAIQSRCQA